MRPVCLLLATLGSAAALPRPFVVLSGLAVAAAACTSNSDCSSGEFCNSADNPECEACYYPGDLPRSVDACARYEDACGAACDGSGGNSSGDGDAEDGSGGNGDPDGGNLPEGCCSEVMEPHQQCVYPTDSTYDRDEVKEPVVSSEALEFATHDDCAAHDAYADCIGETAERCHWVFLSSPKGGFCRVDPISKCLELGNCVCNTEDFQGGGADLGGGIVFHAPVSVTPRDVAPDSRVTSPSRRRTSSRLAIARDLDAEIAPDEADVTLGPSPPSSSTSASTPARCRPTRSRRSARCGDPGDLKMLLDLETEFLRGGCTPDVDAVPSDEGIQTYGSGAFGTLWVAPAEYGTEWWTTDFDEVPPGTNANFNSGMFDELVAGDLYDLTEEMLDLDHYFQEQKMLSHVWENARDWNNPCRFLHQHNNGWLFPFYGSAIEKWEPTDDAAVFDLRSLYYDRGHSGYGFVVHETFHGFQGELCGTYGTCGGRWLAESTASFGCDFNFPGTDTYTAPYVVTPPIPLNMFFDVEPSTHFIDLGISDGVRGGHIYGAFLFWSFLANHAGQPGAVGKMYSVDLGNAGELLKLRALLFAEGLDLGDVFANFVAHLRTVDDPLFADEISLMIETSFDAYNAGIWADNEDGGCPVACDTCEVDDCADSDSWTYGGDDDQDCAWTTVAVSGATAGSVAGPADSRPGPFGWNALKLDGFDAGDFVTITVAWDDLDTDDATANPAALNKVHASCVNDRFFSARVVRLGADGVRTYWKMDGKNPDPVTVEISVGDVVHVLLVPTPPADYVDHPERLYDTFEPVPHYGYGYEVAVADSGSETAAADMAYGVLAYADRGDWFETRCTCLTLSDDLSDCWAPRRARRDDRVPVLGAPTTTPAPSRAPTPAPSRAPTTTTTTTATATTTAAACANDESWKTPPGGVGCAKQTKAGKCKKAGCKWTKQFKKCSKQKARSCSKLFKKYDKKKARGKMKAKDYSKLATLCETMGAADIEASVGCPASCGTCPTPTPTTAGVGAVVGETTTTVGFEGGGAAKWDPCKKKKTKKRCKKKKNKRGKKKCSWNTRKQKCKLKKKKTQ
ncbi:hypothetical protein JL720_11427 [Aureococcus anophagefferens]|nr:hypothetical protein JL720_11427 [Aureococcus anophagefferens]